MADINGLSLNGHKARQLTRELCRQYSLILVMERKHIDAVARLVPEVRGKTMLFGHWLGEREIPDPYGKVKKPLILSIICSLNQRGNGLKC